MIVSEEEEEEQFQLSNICWNCKELIDHDDEKVSDHCHATGKLRCSSLQLQHKSSIDQKRSCNISQFKRLRQSFKF